MILRTWGGGEGGLPTLVPYGWFSMVSLRFPYVSDGFLRLARPACPPPPPCPSNHWFYLFLCRFSLVFIGLDWFLLVFLRFSLVFACFDWFSLGFLWFLLVWIGFDLFSLGLWLFWVHWGGGRRVLVAYG